MDWLQITAAILMCAAGGFLGALIGRWGGSTQLRNFASIVLIASALAVNQMAVRPWLSARRAEQSLRSMAGAAAINELDPDAYRAIVAAMQESKTGQRTDKAQGLYIKSAYEFIKSSTDEAINAYFYAYRMQLDEFADRNLHECNYRVGYKRTLGDVTGTVSPEAYEAVSLAMEELIRATEYDGATAEFDADAAEYDLQRIMDTIRKNRSDDAFLAGTTPDQQPVDTCEVLIQLIDEALEMHSSRSAGFFRYLANYPQWPFTAT
jgi:hypothetical protein